MFQLDLTFLKSVYLMAYSANIRHVLHFSRVIEKYSLQWSCENWKTTRSDLVVFTAVDNNKHRLWIMYYFNNILYNVLSLKPFSSITKQL